MANLSSFIGKCLLITLLLGCKSRQTEAQLSTSRLFGDHMVLQRNKAVSIWGTSQPKAPVTVNINGQSNSTQADANGNWKLTLKPMKAGGPYEMTISSGKDQLHYKDIMLGEVWICSGQSNMEFAMRNTTTIQQEQKVADEVAVRQFLVPEKMSLEEEKNTPSGEWAKASSSTIANFTAVGYYMAKRLSQQLHVTVGIVNATYGGTQIESWISKDILLTQPNLSEAAKNQPDTWDGVKQKVDKSLRNYAYNNKEVSYYKADQLAKEPSSFFMSWPVATFGSWKWMGNWGPFRGQGFMERALWLNAKRAKMPASIKLGETDADVKLYINGKEIVTGSLSKGKEIDIPAGTWKTGDNSILINFLSDQKDPWWFGMGLYGEPKDMYIKFADSTGTLADYRWRGIGDFSKPYKVEPMPNNTVSTLYNAIINPLAGLTVAGIAWYQGESNSARGFEYRNELPLLINNWRGRWKEQVPFILVQLPSYGPSNNSNQGSTWAELREAQAMALKLPATALTVTYDLGDPANLHSPNKAPYGERLASTILNTIYHEPGFGLSPLYTAASFNGGAALVRFTNSDELNGKGGAIKGFELAGSDHVFYPAQAQVINNTVKVTSSQVTNPVAVRYAWSDSPIQANLINKQGLPAGPFRTDSWNTITEKVKFDLK